MKFTFPEDIEGYLSEGEGRLLYTLAKRNPTIGHIVELGSYLGRSTVCLAQGNEEGKRTLFAVDRFTGDEFVGKRKSYYDGFHANIEKYGFGDDVMALRGDTVKVSKIFTQSIRLLFIDAGHTYEQAKGDFHSWERFVVPGGIVAVHDSLYWPGVHTFVTDFILSGLYDTIDTFYEKGGTGLTYGYKAKKVVPKVKRYWNLVRFWIQSHRMAWFRWKLMINMLDESDIRFKIAVLLSRVIGRKP